MNYLTGENGSQYIEYSILNVEDWSEVKLEFILSKSKKITLKSIKNENKNFFPRLPFHRHVNSQSFSAKWKEWKRKL